MEPNSSIFNSSANSSNSLVTHSLANCSQADSSSRSFHNKSKTWAGVVLAVFLVVGSTTLFLHSSSKKSDRFYIWPPNLHAVFNPRPSIMPGITGLSRFDINSLGVRGDEIPAGVTDKIMVMGESTAEDLYLDQKKTWPYLLQRNLNSNNVHAWVGNTGKAGMTTRDVIMHLKYSLTQWPKIDLILVQVGIDDLTAAICNPLYEPHFLSRPDAESRQIEHAFSILPSSLRQSIFSRQGFSRFLKKIRSLYTKRAIVQDQEGEIYQKLRERRKNATRFVDTLPDLVEALHEYRENLKTIIQLAKARGADVILITEPSLWKPKMPAPEIPLLWKGKIGEDEFAMGVKQSDYYSPTALANGLAEFNNAMLESCRENKVECIDLAREIPKNSSIFYDDVHYTEKGAEKVADAVLSSILPRLKQKESLIPGRKTKNL